VWALVVIVVVQQLEGNLLQPVVQSRTVSLHPAVVLIAITAGGGLAGIVGVLVAVPLTAAGAAVLRELRARDHRPAGHQEGDRMGDWAGDEGARQDG
jgi:predicted PurR-regulated permease PerM